MPIGSFQAIKHKFADMIVALERARSTGYFAALTIAEDDPRRTSATSVAKAAAGDCQRLLAKEGIQIHGGIGYTWEHDMHLYVKRIKSGEPLFGVERRPPRAHRRLCSASERSAATLAEHDLGEEVEPDDQREAGVHRVLVRLVDHVEAGVARGR